jgi:hypothetical protein
MSKRVRGWIRVPGPKHLQLLSPCIRQIRKPGSDEYRIGTFIAVAVHDEACSSDATAVATPSCCCAAGSGPGEWAVDAAAVAAQQDTCV